MHAIILNMVTRTQKKQILSILSHTWTPSLDIYLCVFKEEYQEKADGRAGWEGEYGDGWLTLKTLENSI